MIRETIGEPNIVPMEGCEGEKNPEDSSIQHTVPEEGYDGEKSDGVFDSAYHSGGKVE